MSFTEHDLLTNLTRLLPAAKSAEVHDAWSIGEQEGALARLINGLAEDEVSMTELDRAWFAALAEHWGTLEALSSVLRSIASTPEHRAPWETIDGTNRAAQIEAELIREIDAAHVLAGRVLTAWLAASRSDDLLVRVYPREPWGAGWPAVAYAIVHPTWSGAPEPPAWPATRTYESVYDALDAFARRCEA